MAHSTPNPGARSRPTPVAGAFAVAVTAVVGWLVLRTFPEMRLPAAIGTVGVALLAATLRLAATRGDGRRRAGAGFGAGLLVVPTGVVLVGSVTLGTLRLVEDIFPVAEEALLSVGWLLVAGEIAVVVGCSVAVFGLVAARWNLASTDRLARCRPALVAAGSVPAATGGVLLLLAVGSGTTPDRGFGIVVAVGVVAGVALLAALVRAVRGDAGPAVGPGLAGSLAGAGIATGALVVVAERAYTRAVAELLRRFPAEITGEIREMATTGQTAAGDVTVVVLAGAASVLLVGALLVGLYLALAVGLLAEERSGFSLAAIGLGLAAVLGGTVGAPAWLVVGGVTASLLVWDAGEFGTTLRREVGRDGTHRVELVHLCGSAVVGLLGAALALAVIGRLPVPEVVTATDLLALASLVVGILALVVALR